MSEDLLRKTLDDVAQRGRTIQLWLRDDDAVEPSVALDTLLSLTEASAVPVTLAVIPENTGDALAQRLKTAPHASIVVHGWSHRNYAPSGEKKQELGAHRPQTNMLAELQTGFDKLAALYPERFIPMLVPPWNRIAPPLVPELPALGFTLLSVFGKENEFSPIPLLNTHVDIMDWHGTGGGRPAPDLFAELAGWIGRSDAPHVIGILAHHLVHDVTAWVFLERLMTITAAHMACEWVQPTGR